jgi:hypothetical protein
MQASAEHASCNMPVQALDEAVPPPGTSTIDRWVLVCHMRIDTLTRVVARDILPWCTDSKAVCQVVAASECTIMQVTSPPFAEARSRDCSADTAWLEQLARLGRMHRQASLCTLLRLAAE